MSTSSAPFFMTHHAPVAAWSSLTFGLPGRGVSIDQEALAVADSGDLLIAFSQNGTTTALPFINIAAAAGASYAHWSTRAPGQIRRTLTPCIDEFATDRLTLRVYTPHPSIPNPKRFGHPQFSVVPAILLELTADNSHSDQAASAFIGLGYRGPGRLRPMDWSTNGSLIGVGLGSSWGLCALPQSGLSTLRDSAIAPHVEAGKSIIHNTGNEGGILIQLKPGEVKTIPLAFAFYHAGPATQGIEGSYYYTRFFIDLESAANFILRNVGRIKESCEVFDKRLAQMIPDDARRALLGQGLRAYNANAQLIIANDIPYYNVNDGQNGWRNSIDLAVDHLPWELYRNPWVARNIFDLFSAHYSYRDELIFPQNAASATALHSGGLSFCHDVGAHTTYGPEGSSGYEMPDRRGPGAYMTHEALLDGIYLLTSYALLSDDEPWARTRLATARELLDSLEARDHHDATQRNGILKAESSIAGLQGAQVTTFAGVDEALGSAAGNLYLAFKTWCATLLLTAYFQQQHDDATAQRAYNFAHRTANTLAAAFNAEKKMFPASLASPASPALLLAALDPLALPAFCNLQHYFLEFPDLLAKLAAHAQSCLAGGACQDAAGGLRLSSTSAITMPSKIVNILFVLEHVLSIGPESWPNALTKLVEWTHTGAAETTLADQIDVTTNTVTANRYYPRLASAAIWLRPATIPDQPA